MKSTGNVSLLIMDIIDFETQQIQDYDKLSEEELLSECMEVDGEFYFIDENHSGFLFLTNECAEKYNIECGENGDAEPIDWVIWCDPDDITEYKDKGYKWNFYIMQCAGVYNKNGEQIRYGYEDEDVCRLNGIDPLMLEDPGCITMGWCDG